MFRSLRFRMAASHAGVLAVILVVLGGITQALLARSLDQGVTSSLRDAAVQVVDKVQESGRPQVPLDSDIPSRSVIRIGVFLPDGRAVSGGEDRPPSWLRPSGTDVSESRADGERVRLVTLPARDDDGGLIATVVAARSLVPEISLVHRVRMLLFFGGLAAVAASLLAGWWLAGRALHPVRRAYEAQASFAADASHELRTPLAYVRQAVEVMAEKDPELGGEVLEEVDYLAALTQRLLLMARADRGGLGLESGPLDLDEVCRSAARRAIQVHGLLLELPAQNGALPVLADRIAAEAALDAVFENVGMHGGGAAQLRWFVESDRAVVSVADHGPGLSPDERASAFERFFRADPARTRGGGGAGLGLPLAKSLVVSQKGSIWVEPTSGGGLTVKMAYPLATRVP